MRAVALVGFVAFGFGVGSYYATDSFTWFNQANLAIGALALLAASVHALARLRRAGHSPVFQRVVGRGLLAVALTLAAAVGAERAAYWSDLRVDWSFGEQYALSPAVQKVLEELSGRVDATLYYDEFDPRTRSTRLLLQAMERTGHLDYRAKRLESHPEEADRFAVGSANSVVLQLGGAGGGDARWRTVGSPNEGTLYEALYRLRSREGGLLYVATGAGEGSLRTLEPHGFSGLGQALRTEGYRVKEFVSAAVDEIPSEATAVLVVAPERRWRRAALDALDRYLEGGGRLVAFLEPGETSGVEELLARWGLASPDRAVIDPASGPVEGDPAGVNPIAFNYATSHPVARSLSSSRMTFFRGARAFEPRKPRARDDVESVVFSSHRAWTTGDLSALDAAAAPEPPPDAERGYQPLVAVGSYERGGRETRIVAFGDSELASNRYLRTLYNLDLVLNAVHWAAEREPAITLRPKAAVSGGLQFVMPVQNTLTMFQSLGLVLPELLLIAAGLVWLRGRGA